jgi:hypothetical protein
MPEHAVADVPVSSLSTAVANEETHLECPPVPLLGQVWFADDLEANQNAPSRQEATWAIERACGRLHTGMQSFHEFLAKKAKVYPDLFRIQRFVGLAQPIPLKPTERTPKPGRRLKPRRR